MPTKRGAHLALSIERLAALGRAAAAADRACPPRSGRSTRWRGSSAAWNARRRSAASPPDAEAEIADEFAAHQGEVRYRPVTIVDAGAKKALKLTIEVPVEDMARLTTADDLPSGPASVGDAAAVDLVGHPPAAARADSRASLDADLRQQPPAGGAPGRRAQRTGRRNARAVASRIDRPRAARRSRRPAEGGRAARARRHLVARARHRHGRHRPRRPDRGAAVGRERAAAHRARRPPGERGQRRRDLPEVPRRSRGERRRRQGDARRRRRGDPLSAQPARHRRPADRRDGLDGHLGRRRPLRDDPPRGAVRRVEPDGVRRRARHAVGTLPVGRIRGAAAARHLGSAEGHDHRARGRQARGDRQRRHDSRPRIVRRLPAPAPERDGAGRRARRRARRRNGVREPRRRDVRPRRLVVADRGDHARPRARVARAGRAGKDAVLERRPRGPAARARARDRPPDARPAAADAGRRRAPADRAITISTPGPPRTCSSTCAIRSPRRARSPTPVRSSSSACATSSATGASACCRRAADGFTRRGRWPRRRRSARRPASTSRRCGETTGSSCGFRMSIEPPDPRLLLPDPDEVQALVVRQLGATALFAAKFRENAARSLLLPKRRPGMRAPLWQQRKRAADLLAVASRYGSFPVLLETYRECLRDFFDMPALVSTLADVRSRKIRVATVDSEKPSPFAASLLFSYVASFLYDGDAPLAERRAQALAVDQAQLRELLGDAELRELLDADSMEAIERQLQRLDPQYRAKSADAVHDMLLGDRRSHQGGTARARAERRRRRERRRARRRAPDSLGAHRRRAAVHRGRGRRAVPRRPGRAAAGRPSRVAAAAGARSARRSGDCGTRGRTRRSPPRSSPRDTRSVRWPPKRC